MEGSDRAHVALQFRALSEDQIERLYQATLECVNRTGVNVLNAEARRLLIEAGAQLDGVRARIPPRIIEDAVAAAPSSFGLWARDGSYKLEIAPDCVHFGPGPTCSYFVDPESGERRATRRGDPGRTAQVCDALPNIDYVMSLGLISDVSAPLAPVYEFAEMLANTIKPVLPWAYSPDNVSDLYEIAVAVAGSEEALRSQPFFALFSTYHSPLIQTDWELANTFWAAKHGVPVIFTGGGTAGSTSPITGAGTLVITLAGALTSLALVQLKVPGAPVCIGGVPEAMDLRTASPAYGSPEMSLYSAALSDVCRYLDLPFMGTAGASEAKILDLQAAIESTLQVVLSGLSGASMVHDVGFLDCANIGSLEMLVMTDEIIAMTRRVMRGIEINDDTLMLDLIDRVGPGGEFVSQIETARLCRTEIWHPTLLDRDTWVGWEAAGALTMQDRIRERVRTILSTHQALPLPAVVENQIDDILRAAEERLS